MSRSIPQDFIRELVSSADIISLVDSYVPLRKKGKDHWGQCPFCDDGKNPSFSVSPQKQFYYCFKCGETGNSVSFLQSHLGLSFIEAIETLATKAGVQIPYDDKNITYDDHKLIYEVLEEAANLFQSNLIELQEAQRARTYLKEDRLISPKTCEDFNIGFALDSWTALSGSLLKKGHLEKDIIQAGLAKKNKEGKLFDIFRNRIIFPIRDTRGRTVGFGGRVMDPKDQPKYLNTGDTPVFKKSNQLYGLFESNKLRKEMHSIYVVEGYLDVIAMFENGINYSVATLGIASNKFHVQKILQLVDKIIFCFDGDEAGRGAAWSALKNSLPVVKDEAELRFLFLPEHEDPASLLEKEDKESFLLRQKQSLILSDYFINHLNEMVGLTNSLEKKASLASKAMTLLQTMPDCVLKNLLEIEVSKATGLQKEEIQNLTKLSLSKSRNNSYRKLNNKETEKIYNLSSFSAKAIKALIQYPYLAGEVKSGHRLEEYESNEVKLLLKIAEKYNLSSGISLSEVMLELDKEENEFIGALLANSVSINDTNIADYFNDCLTKIESEDHNRRISQLKELMEERQLSSEEIFELQQHLVSNFDDLGTEDKELLKTLSKERE